MDRSPTSTVDHATAVRTAGSATLDELYLEYAFFGSRRRAVALEVNRKRIQRLMRILGIEALYPKPNRQGEPISDGGEAQAR